MRFASRVLIIGCLLACGTSLTTAWKNRERVPRQSRHHAAVANYFQTNPLADPTTFIAGDALERVTYELSPPAFPGDRPGSLTARYDSTASGGLLGLWIRHYLTEDSDFTVAAIAVIASDGFVADPNGFFQISWGAWNSAHTGLRRTGDFVDFSGDTFELLEFDYFPNVSPFFGGPYLSPAIFGAADPDHPSFDALGSFANASFAFGPQVTLPFDVPLLMVMEHRAASGEVVVSVHRIINARRTTPVAGATATIDLAGLGMKSYEFDMIGLTLWHDGFGGAEPSLQATVVFHALIARAGFYDSVDAIIRTPPRR
jgi:hypothetical protein